MNIMNISKVIKEQRNKLSLSQEELAERLYVTRHTIGNWENDRSYPDIRSLILLSQIFDVTIDNLIKGDLEMMNQIIEEKDIRKLKRNFTLGTVGAVAGIMFLFVTQMIFYFGSTPYIIGMGTGVVVALWGAVCFIRIDYIEKKYDVQTFREVLAFSRGEALDEIEKVKEAGKRPYQYALFIIIALVIAVVLSKILWHFSPNQPVWMEIIERLR